MSINSLNIFNVLLKLLAFCLETFSKLHISTYSIVYATTEIKGLVFGIICQT